MEYRIATIKDIKEIQIVRNLVKENKLSNPALVTDEAVEDFILNRGKGWVCVINNVVIGFSIADLVENNIWALFVHPEYEGKGVGKQLHQLMLDWYFTQTKVTVWLGTSPKTRAENFYKKAGWLVVGLHGNDETKFEMTATKWKSLNETP
jgi:GNAT superfamily N-acetyltransferase